MISSSVADLDLPSYQSTPTSLWQIGYSLGGCQLIGTWTASNSLLETQRSLLRSHVNRNGNRVPAHIAIPARFRRFISGQFFDRICAHNVFWNKSPQTLDFFTFYNYTDTHNGISKYNTNTRWPALSVRVNYMIYPRHFMERDHHMTSLQLASFGDFGHAFITLSAIIAKPWVSVTFIDI